MTQILRQLFAMMAMAMALTACGAGTSSSSGIATDSDSSATDNIKQDTTPMATTTDKYVLIHTTEGDITVQLYGDTPRHQANFLKLVKEGTYDGTLFHRVINEFMIQAGDPDSKTARPAHSSAAATWAIRRRPRSSILATSTSAALWRLRARATR